MAKTNKSDIKVITHYKGDEPNSYELVVNGNSFLYFTEADFLLGVIAHVGLHEFSPVNKNTVLTTILNMIMGKEYAEHVDNLKHCIKDMSHNITELDDKLENIKKEMVPINPKPAKAEKPKAGRKKSADKAAEKIADLEERMKSNPNIK